jgi:hypothetical protein
VPDTPKVEEIELEVLSRLQAISQAAGYWFDYREVSRKLRMPNECNDFPVLFMPPAREPGDLQVQTNDRVLVQPVWGYCNDEGDQGSELNKVRQDVERALFEQSDNEVLSLGYVIMLELFEVRKWQVDGEYTELIRLEFHITYRYDHGDP